MKKRSVLHIAASTAGAALAALGCASPEPVGTVAVALTAEQCAAYCAAELRAEIYRTGEDSFPLGPAAQGACGERLTFGALPAGTSVYVTLDVFDDTGARRLAGRSEAVTVVADGAADATIRATALAPPTLTAASPDPVVVTAAPVLVTLAGANLGTGRGDAGATLGARELSVDWANHAVAITAGTPGGELVVRACGVASNPVPLRVIGAALGVDPVSVASGCEVTALAADPDAGGVLAAFACAAPSESFVQRFRAADVCPLDGDEVWHVAGRPTAVAPGWVGLEAGVARFDVARPGDAEAAQGTGLATALQAADTGVYGIVGGRLVEVDAGLAPVAGVDAGLELVALAPIPDGVAALAGSGGEGRVVTVTGPAPTVVTLSVPACHGPRALAADAARFVLGCDDGLVVVARATQDVKQLSDVAADRLALDPRGDVAFAWEVGASVAVVDLAGAAVLATWPLAVAPARPLLVALDGDPASGVAWLVATGATASALTVWTPYDPEGPCR